jgi:hypothetical protein
LLTEMLRDEESKKDDAKIRNDPLETQRPGAVGICRSVSLSLSTVERERERGGDVKQCSSKQKNTRDARPKQVYGATTINLAVRLISLVRAPIRSARAPAVSTGEVEPRR